MQKIETALTITEAAKVKGITRQAMHYAIENGKVKTIKVLGRVGILPEELAKYQPRASNKVEA